MRPRRQPPETETRLPRDVGSSRDRDVETETTHPECSHYMRFDRGAVETPATTDLTAIVWVQVHSTVTEE